MGALVTAYLRMSMETFFDNLVLIILAWLDYVFQ